jgi:putative copper export protein/methionine-rich copper-binding protein CopC
MTSRRRRVLGRAASAACLAIALLALAPVVGPRVDPAAGYLVAAHSALVASSPGAGSVVTTAPSELRLVFSEPVDPGFTSLDLLDSSGAALLSNVGEPDPADPRVLVAVLPAGTIPRAGLFTVRWRTLSASDGHVTRGFFTFGVGDVTAAEVGAADAGGSGGLHGGHAAGIVVVEIPGKVLGYGGSMLAFGLAILGFLVLRPAARGEAAAAGGAMELVSRPAARRRRPRSAEGPPTSLASVFRATPLAAGWALVAGAAGCAILLAIAVASLSGSGGSTGIVAVMAGTRSGALLTARIVLGVVGGAAVLGLHRVGGANGPGRALALAGLAGFGGLALTAAGSHAAAFASPVPTVVDVVHLAAASIWLSGLGLLAALTDFGRGSRLAPGALRSIIPRFSALALVSVAAIALTGAYADWTLTRDPFSVGTPYQLSLAVKIAVFAAALALGALNYFDGGEERPGRGGLSRRLVAELVAGFAVLTIAANLTSGSPTALDRPVGIEPAASTAASGAELSLDLYPGRAGPNRFVTMGPAVETPGVVVEMVLQRLDAEEGTSRITMRPEPVAAAPRFVADASLAESSRWDATIVTTDPVGTETGRQRFVFALDAAGVSEGRSVPPVDPAMLLAVLLLALGIAGLAFGLAGGVLPRTLPDASRPALIGAGTIGTLLGLAILVGAGPG